MVNATTLVKSLFITPSEAVYILARIEFLVVVATVLFLVRFIMDIFRRNFHSTTLRSILSIIDGASDNIVTYVMGVMHTAPFKNHMLPVWAIVLVGFRNSMGYITGYDIRDYGGKRFMELTIVFNLGAAILNKTRGSEFAYPIWLLWGLQVIRSLYRFQTRNQAFNSIWHGKSSELVSEYMRTDEYCANFKPDECKPETMQGYKYLVYGETKRHILLQKPRYVLQIDTKPIIRAQAQARTRAWAREQAMRKAKKGAQAKARAARGRDQARGENTVEQTNPYTRHPTERESVSPQAWQNAGRESTASPVSPQLRDPAEWESTMEPGSTQRWHDATRKSTTSPVNPQIRHPGECENTMEPISPQTWHGAERENSISPENPNTRPPVQNGSATTNLESLITLDRIWTCDGALLKSTDGDKFKDLSLAFSLSRLLRCKLEGMKLHTESIPITKKLVLYRIIKEQAERAFWIMELEMAFINDYFNTRLPMIFWCGFGSLYFSVILSIATFAVTCWLFIDIIRVHKSHTDEVTHTVHDVRVDMLITYLFMVLMMFKEIWEMVSYLLSDWTRLLLACSYVRKACRCMRNGLMEKFISSFLTSKFSHHRWHGDIDQHAFLQSYDDSPSVWNLMHTITTGAIPKKEQGTKLEAHIKIPEYVKHAVLKTLRSLDLTHDHLPNVVPTLMVGKRKRYRWACSELPTSSHIILVWHIATSLCEIRFARDHDINLSNPGFPISALLYLTSFCRCWCCSPQPYLVKEKILDDLDDANKDTDANQKDLDANPKDLDDNVDAKPEDLDTNPKTANLKTKYIVANSLSRYCAYLLVSKPDLLPDSFLMPKIVFEETVQYARHILKDSDSLEKRYDRLKAEADRYTSNSSNTRNIVQHGAKLGMELIDNESEISRWEILAGVWADLLVHIAPTWNAEAHKKCLESGGEFITHIWALLWHCGIEKSMLWPVEDVPENNAPGARENSIFENNSVQLVKPVQQAAAARERGNKQQVLANTEPDGGHRLLNSDLANGQANVVRKMKNLGNTCYFNAVLQSLLALDELRIRMLELDPPPGGALYLELKKLFKDTSVVNYAEGTLVPENLFNIMCSRHEDINQGEMGDSSLALRSLLNDLINEEPEGRNLPSMIKSLFNGEVVTSVSSKQCGHNSVTIEALVLSLAIPSKEPVSIKDCLELYAAGKVDDWDCTDCQAAAAAAGIASSSQADTTVNDEQTEQLDSGTHHKEQSSHSTLKETSTPNQDKEKLPNLDGVAHQMEQSHNNHTEGKKISRTATLKYRISKAPPVLTIQLKRFDYVNQDRSAKLAEHVTFQETLDITEFMDPRHVEDGMHKYCLVAVIVHEGPNLHEGHNFAYVRARIVDHNRKSSGPHSWFCASDEDITEVSLEQVLDCQAYILFYQRAEQLEVKAGLEDIHSQITDQEKHKL